MTTNQKVFTHFLISIPIMEEINKTYNMKTIKIIFIDTMLKDKTEHSFDFNVKSETAENKLLTMKAVDKWMKAKQSRDLYVPKLLVGKFKIKVLNETGYCLVRGEINGDVFSGKWNYTLKESFGPED